MGLFDLSIPEIWGEIGNLKEHIFNRAWGVWVRIESLEQEKIPEIHEKLNNQEWGVWHRIVTLEEQNAGNRLAALEKENAELKERVRKLEELADNLGQLEVMLTRAVNEQLGKH